MGRGRGEGLAEAVGAEGVAGVAGAAGVAGVVRAAGVAREPVTLDALAERVRPATLARDRQLPVLTELEPLLPGGALQRGTTVAVDAGPGVTGATTLALAVAAGASQAGSWVAMVGLDSVGLVAAARLGVALERLALVAPSAAASRRSGTGSGSGTVGWASVMGALVDGFDLVLVAAGPGARRRPADARRLVARARERGAVLVAVGGELPGQRSNVWLTVTSAEWRGLEDGAGHLQGRRVTVATSGRGEAARPRRAELWLPTGDGLVAAAEPSATPIPLRDRDRDRERDHPPAHRQGAALRAGPAARSRRPRTGHPPSAHPGRAPGRDAEVSEGAAS